MVFQRFPYSCGAAACVNALRCVGIKVSERTVRKYSGTTEEHGTSETGIKNALSSLGCVAREYTSTKKSDTILWLTGAVLEGQACVICVSNDNHWVCVIGKIGDNFIIIDPSNAVKNKEENGIHILSKRQLTRLWSNKEGIYYAISVSKRVKGLT